MTARGILFACGWLGASFASVAGATEAPRELFFRLTGEFASQRLGDVNSTIRDGQNLIPRETVLLEERENRERFGATWAWGADAGTYLTPRWRFGAAGRLQSSSVTNSRRIQDPADPRGGADVTDEIDLRLAEISGILEYWWPGAVGLHFGFQAGVGFGEAKGKYSRRDFQDPDADLSLDTTADGHGPTWGLYVGSRPKRRLFTRVGYRWRDLGTFDAKTTSPQLGTLSVSPRREDGGALHFDFSGFYLAVGLEFRREIEPRSTPEPEP